MNQLLLRLHTSANIIQECYEEGAFRRLESGSDREREALAHLLRIMEEHRKLVSFYGGVPQAQEVGQR